VSETAFHAKKMLQEVEKWVSRDDRVEILSADADVFNPTDE
jgi:hypothetical protein